MHSQRAMLAASAALTAQAEGGKLQEDPVLLLQIHDELVYEVCESDVQTAGRVLQEAMEAQGRALSIPLPVSIKAGPDWGSLEPLVL